MTIDIVQTHAERTGLPATEIRKVYHDAKKLAKKKGIQAGPRFWGFIFEKLDAIPDKAGITDEEKAAVLVAQSGVVESPEVLDEAVVEAPSAVSTSFDDKSKKKKD